MTFGCLFLRTQSRQDIVILRTLMTEPNRIGSSGSTECHRSSFQRKNIAETNYSPDDGQAFVVGEIKKNRAIVRSTPVMCKWCQRD
ncbi:hypothetical protein TNIN_172631 [Trichonephila inaurata madagascariensis]|uniref:Uncharacterized protein n=1 Tax=Trichonephila inaurata madagascariensis TaxID=2747483 RepID=A0A8X6XB19_9ARAC|nr:hypothetical protein TNIN_172631 [Trichonephila inaurata madagascariensis]